MSVWPLKCSPHLKDRLTILCIGLWARQRAEDTHRLPGEFSVWWTLWFSEFRGSWTLEQSPAGFNVIESSNSAVLGSFLDFEKHLVSTSALLDRVQTVSWANWIYCHSTSPGETSQRKDGSNICPYEHLGLWQKWSCCKHGANQLWIYSSTHTHAHTHNHQCFLIFLNTMA